MWQECNTKQRDVKGASYCYLLFMNSDHRDITFSFNEINIAAFTHSLYFN